MQFYYGNNMDVFVDGFQQVSSTTFLSDATLKGTLCYRTGTGYTGSITGATAASPIVITSVSHGLSNGDQVVIRDVEGNTAANGVFTVSSAATNTFALSGTTGSTAWSYGGTWYKVVPSAASLSFSYLSGSDGRYKVLFPGSLQLRRGTLYALYIIDSGSYANTVQWFLPVEVTDRTS